VFRHEEGIAAHSDFVLKPLNPHHRHERRCVTLWQLILSQMGAGRWNLGKGITAPPNDVQSFQDPCLHLGDGVTLWERGSCGLREERMGEQCICAWRNACDGVRRSIVVLQ
jgi:hypothetical protein